MYGAPFVSKLSIKTTYINILYTGVHGLKKSVQCL